MVSLQTPVRDFGRLAPDFNLPGVDGRLWSRDDCKGDRGLMVMFICNHCPYVKAVIDRIIRDARELSFPFPYLLDETQEVAKAYGAVCTPDFFGYNADLELQYRGRLDESRKEAAPADVRRDLYEAMRAVAATGEGPRDQIPSMGCSITWRDD